jgi:hypothetical protein
MGRAQAAPQNLDSQRKVKSQNLQKERKMKSQMWVRKTKRHQRWAAGGHPRSG